MDWNEAGLAAVTPSVASLSGRECLTLKRAPNGGWVVSLEPNQVGVMSDILGAYSSTEDMLEALRRALG